MRGITILFCVAILVMMAVPAGAAGTGTWGAWVYEPSLGQVMLVEADGTVSDQFTLPGEPDVQYSRYVHVTEDGTLMLYATTSPAGVNVYAYNAIDKVLLYTAALPVDSVTSMEFASSNFTFAEENASFAYGYGSMTGGWHVVVVNLLNGDEITLDKGDTLAFNAGIRDENAFLIPVVRAWRSNEVRFTMVLGATEGQPFYNSYIWNLGTNLVAPSQGYVSLNSDTFWLNGEELSALHDERFPGGIEPVIGFRVPNTLQVYAFDADVRSVVFQADPTEMIYRPLFIQNGERILAGFAKLGTGAEEWRVFERSLSLVSSVDMEQPTSIAGTWEGFIFTAGNTLYYVDTTAATPPFVPVSVWTASVGSQFEIVWVSDVITVGEGEYMPWPAVDAPALPAALRVGALATIVTTEGDRLRMRSGAGTNFEVMEMLDAGTRVTILEGPIQAGGLTWWRIQTPDGQQGWVVQEIEGVKTLLPIGG